MHDKFYFCGRLIMEQALSRVHTLCQKSITGGQALLLTIEHHNNNTGIDANTNVYVCRWKEGRQKSMPKQHSAARKLLSKSSYAFDVSPE
jgi:hypothetical protein